MGIQWYEEDRCPRRHRRFLNQLDGYEDIDIYFNSGGGDVFAGLAIYNQLKHDTTDTKSAMLTEWLHPSHRVIMFRS
ncbi:MAG: ATP-dependent Clp protease proteolytic subunit [Anaerobutyricum hallii]